MPEGSTPTPSQEALEADIERQRQQLARTLDELGTKLDVKTQVKNRVQPQQLVALGAAALVVVGLLVWRRKR